jgi:uncharacterized protein (TIGR04255 family)
VRGPTLPAVAYERFANPPLRVMLGQVQFPPILRLQTGVQAVAEFQEAIRELFPGFGVEHQIQITIPPGGEEPATSRAAAYRFTNERKTWSVLLAPSALTLEGVEGGRYTSYSEFAELFRSVWVAAVELLRPAKVSRQGLRYVDHLEGARSPMEWAEWVNPELLGGVAREVLGTGLDRTLCELTYPQTDGLMIFRHGIGPAGPENAKGYLLDFDSIHSDPVEPEDLEGIMARFEESHDVLYRFFRWCVTERALEEFRRATA